MRIHYLLPVLFIFFTSSCSRPSFYQIANFEHHTKSHEVIAILPFEVYTFGKLPADIDEKDLIEMENVESAELQAQLYEGILESKHDNQDILSVKLQHHNETNLILESSGISVRDSWSYTPDELAELLDVDAVLIARVEKEQSFSDGISAAIEIGQVLLSILANDVYLDGRAANKTLIGDYALVSRDGVVLWQLGSDKLLDWKYNQDRCIKRMNSRSAKYFPY